MDEQAVAGADRCRSTLLRALVLIGGVLAGTALAWLLSSATASAAEESPVSGLVSTAGYVIDNSVTHTVHIGQDAKAAAQALPAAAPAVPALQVPVPHLVAPVILVEQRLGDLAQAGAAEASDPVVTRTFTPIDGSSARHRAESAPAAARVAVDPAPAAAARPQASLGTTPAAPMRPGGLPKSSEAVPFGALPGGACGHDGPINGGGACLGDGVAVAPAAAPFMPTHAPSRCVPMTARRQPGITPD
jgi:hypothetical protein